MNTPCLKLTPTSIRWVFIVNIGQFGFWILIFFLVVLTIGFVYEYASGALNYANKDKDSEHPPFINNNSLTINRNYKYSVRNFSSVSNNDNLKDYWLNIKPVSKWY